MSSARHPYARHLRNEIARELPTLSGGMLDPMSHAMATISALAMSTNRNVVMINVGDAPTMLPSGTFENILKPLRRRDGDVADSIIHTGLAVVSKRRSKPTLRISGLLHDLLDDLGRASIKGAFLIEAMDDGQVRATPLSSELDDLDPNRVSTSFHHCEDALPTG